MAAPKVAGVAALMVSREPELRRGRPARALLQNAPGARCRSRSGYLDALGAVLAASTTVGYDTTPAAATCGS